MGYKAGFELVGLDPDAYVAGDEISVRGPCFMCGGHHRMLVFIDKPFPSWWLRCDECGIEGWLDQFFPFVKDKVIDDGVQDEGVSTDESRQAILESLRESKIYLEMHHSMTDENRKWWVGQGIPEDWQDFWKLGFVKDKAIRVESRIYTRDAYSIPKFGLDGKLYNIDYRIVDAPMGEGKYRPEPGLLQALFIARPDFGAYHNKGMVIIVEGSKKAMVLAVRLGDVQVLGVPARRSWAGVVDKVKDVPRVIVILDPDAGVSAAKLVDKIGRNARRVTLPTKPDDGFLSEVLTPEMFWRLIRQNARRP